MAHGRLEECTFILRRLITKRFGHVPAWADELLAKLSIEELEDLSLRVLDAQSVAEMFQL